jgi:crotonobetaine/carnitine-CoA ligase
MDVWSFVAGHAERTPDKTLLRYEHRHQTYAEVLRGALTMARVLHELGVRQGQTVCLMLGNSPTYLYAWFGLARLGAVAVPINVHLRGEGLAYILDHSEAALLVVAAELLPRLQALQPLPSRLRTIVVDGDAAALATADSQQRRYLLLGELVAAAEPACPGAVVPAEAVSGILYTSGTTGPPKGVMLSHAAYLNSARSFAEEMVRASPDDVLYTTLPLFHINAQAHTVLPAIHLNATIALGQRFSASGFWDDIRRHGATIFNSLAAMIPILCKQPPGPHDRDHQARLTACAATPNDVWLEFEQRFGVRIVEGYGLTETAGFCVTNPLEAIRLGSIGKPMGFVETRVVGPHDEPLAPDQVGEIAIRARAEHVLMEGYYRMPAQTAEAMRGGWFHSGDAGYADADGYLYFVDRIKQSIRRRGENISSWEVEKVVNAHPQVLESAAVGYPSEVGEEEVRVVIVPRPGEAIAPLDIVRWCEERMAYFMVPRYVEFRASLPKTATERVEKYKLKQEPLGDAWDREASGYRLRRD